MKFCREHLPVCFLLCTIFLAVGLLIGCMTLPASNSLQEKTLCFVIDAGHGGIDGGAVSCNGINEADINLEISLRLRDLMHLLGMQTTMVRTEDISIYTSGDSIAAKKVSDLKNRAAIVNQTNSGFLLSIHQNYFEQSQYSGAQVFYNNEAGKELADIMQNSFVANLNMGSNRRIKRAKGVYLMEHIEKPGVLVECGFLSNPAEEKNLRQPQYQKKICCIIAATCITYQSGLDRA